MNNKINSLNMIYDIIPNSSNIISKDVKNSNIYIDNSFKCDTGNNVATVSLVDEKINIFLSFLESKGIIKKEEFEEYKKSLLLLKDLDK